MTDRIVGPVAGVCPICGDPNIEVPESYDDNTIIECAGCRYRAPHAEFFKTPKPTLS
jgi:hypothetical protein